MLILICLIYTSSLMITKRGCQENDIFLQFIGHFNLASLHSLWKDPAFPDHCQHWFVMPSNSINPISTITSNPSGQQRKKHNYAMKTLENWFSLSHNVGFYSSQACHMIILMICIPFKMSSGFQTAWSYSLLWLTGEGTVGACSKFNSLYRLHVP